MRRLAAWVILFAALFAAATQSAVACDHQSAGMTMPADSQEGPVALNASAAKPMVDTLAFRGAVGETDVSEGMSLSQIPRNDQSAPCCPCGCNRGLCGSAHAILEAHTGLSVPVVLGARVAITQ